MQICYFIKKSANLRFFATKYRNLNYFYGWYFLNVRFFCINMLTNQNMNFFHGWYFLNTRVIITIIIIIIITIIGHGSAVGKSMSRLATWVKDSWLSKNHNVHQRLLFHVKAVLCEISFFKLPLKSVHFWGILKNWLTHHFSKNQNSETNHLRITTSFWFGDRRLIA